ncbi:MAG: 7-carboxy-7-deazaguanine synthase QueE [Chlorobi bacterium]|nr:7-carboxy-7-deazaguanine synthase QueE [Chlorobiota bacterium]
MQWDPEGKRLPVMETFVSVQGEGFHTGTPSFFIRIGGCDVGCHWCDVKESWNPELHPLREVDQIVEEIPDTLDTVIITGGEPLQYPLEYLTRRLKEKGKIVHLETSGTGPFKGHFDWVCLSPKKFQAPLPEAYDRADELKIIVFNRSDFDFAEAQADKVRPGTRLYLQPEWSRRERMLPEIVEYIVRHPRWKLSVQTHKYLGLP